MNFYDLTVPMLQAYLKRMNNILSTLESETDQDLQTILQARLQPDMLPFSQQVNCVAGFALRTCFPLMQQPTPGISYEDESLSVIQKNIHNSLNTLVALSPNQFTIPEQETIITKSGYATMELKPLPFIQEYAIPNFFFHFSMAYAILRAQGIELCKEDFDGLTQYPKDFRF